MKQWVIWLCRTFFWMGEESLGTLFSLLFFIARFPFSIVWYVLLLLYHTQYFSNGLYIMRVIFSPLLSENICQLHEACSDETTVQNLIPTATPKWKTNAQNWSTPLSPPTNLTLFNHSPAAISWWWVSISTCRNIAWKKSKITASKKLTINN